MPGGWIGRSAGDPKTPAWVQNGSNREETGMTLNSSEWSPVELEQALLRPLRLGYKNAMRRQRVENLRITFRPCIVDFHPI